jgi:hypothetical protein
MIYELRCMASGLPGHREISRYEYHQLRVARRSLTEVLSVEENYNGLLDRYITMQRELVTAILQVELHRPVDGVDFHGYSQRLAREAACLLSVGRQYLDHTAHSVSEIARLNGKACLPFREWCGKEYDERPGYRAIEAIRNAAQHRMLPSQGIAIGGAWVDEGKRRQRRHSVSLRVYPKILQENPKFKKKIAEELLGIAMKNHEDFVDLMDLIREHLTGLATIHDKLRLALADEISSWEYLIEATLESWRKDFGRDLALAANARDGRNVESVPIFGDYLMRRRRMTSQNDAGPRTFDFHIRC